MGIASSVRVIVLASVLAGCGLEVAMPLRAQGTSPITKVEQNALNDFAHRASNYMKGERALPASKLKPTSDANELESNRKKLQQAIQAWRPKAKQGDLFTPASAVAFRKLLAYTLAGPDGKEISTSLSHAEPFASTALRVNAPFPTMLGQPLQSVPASLLKCLPTLPNGIEYRIAGKSLALRDTNANLVVDYLSDALP